MFAVLLLSRCLPCYVVSMERGHTRGRVPPERTKATPRWLGTVTEIVVAPAAPETAMANAIDAIKEIHKVGPTRTLVDLVDRPYARVLPKGKTLHVVEHRVDQGDGLFAACCSKAFVSRLRGAPAQIVSRIHLPACDRANADAFWRRSGTALVDDGSEHPVVRKRVDQLVAQIESGKHLPNRPLSPGPHSRAGARDYEIKCRFDDTLEWLTVARQFEYREEIVELRCAVRVRVLDPTRRPLEGASVTLVAHDTKGQRRGATDRQGEITFASLPPGNYGVRAFDDRGIRIGAASVRPEIHRFMKEYFEPVPRSTPWAGYQELHRTARRTGRRPTKRAATEWLTYFFPEFLEREERRFAVIETLRQRSSTGMGRFRPTYRSPARLAEALTAAHVDMTPRAVRKAVAALERRYGRR